MLHHSADMFYYSLCVWVFLFIIYYSLGRPNCIDEDTSIIIDIQDGTIRGSKLESMNNTFYAFREIPYALPPVGPLRFKEPQPASKWEGILNTTENTKICISFALTPSSDPKQNEDCLYLNVYTPVDPRNKVTKLLPVLFWIHGGSFLSGSGIYEDFGPGFLMGYDIILVSINYRLGPFGFLSTEDDVIPGNIALKDQHLALQWVQNNIEYFGGNPNEVTIMGQSAGAAAVGYHVLSEKSEGLFRAAIMESGSPLICWSLQKHPKDAAYDFGRLLDLNFNSNHSTKDLLKLLQNTPVEKFTELVDVVMVLEQFANCYTFFYLVWTPMIENRNLKNPLITGLTHENIKEGKANRVPLMIGVNSQEVLAFDLDFVRGNSILFDVKPATMVTKNMNMAETNRTLAGPKLKQFYTNESLSLDFPAACNFASDTLFTTPVARHAYLQSQYTDVYFYQFSYMGKLGKQSCGQTVEGAEGVCHGEELEYLFVHRDNQDPKKYPQSDLVTQKRLLELWTGFVKTLNPTSEKLDILQNITWPKVTPEQFVYLDIDTDLKIAQNPRKYIEWQKVVDEYADELLDSY